MIVINEGREYTGNFVMQTLSATEKLTFQNQFCGKFLIYLSQSKVATSSVISCSNDVHDL